MELRASPGTDDIQTRHAVPVPSRSSACTVGTLFAGGKAATVCGGAKELPDDEYPLILNTGRLLEHWHTGTMTRRAQALDTLQPGPFVEIHSDDLQRYGLTANEPVTVRSRRGAIRLPARASIAVAPGSVFIPFHFREAAANVLTIDELDPYGKIPEFKFCAVRLER